MGTLCLIDRAPRTLDENQLARLDDLAGWAEHELATLRLSQATRRLRESEARLRAIVDHAAEGILTFGTDGRVKTANRAAAEALGARPHELVGRTVTDLLGGLTWGELAADLAAGSALGRPRRLEGRRLDGSVFPLDVVLTEAEVDGMPLFIALGHHAGAVPAPGA